MERNKDKKQKKARVTGCRSEIYSYPDFPDYMGHYREVVFCFCFFFNYSDIVQMS